MKGKPEHRLKLNLFCSVTRFALHSLSAPKSQEGKRWLLTVAGFIIISFLFFSSRPLPAPKGRTREGPVKEQGKGMYVSN